MIGKIYFKEGNLFYQFIEFIKSFEIYEYYIIDFNKDEQQIIFKAMDKQRISICVFIFNKATINSSNAQTISIETKSFNTFIKKFKTKRSKEFELEFNLKTLEIKENITNQKIELPINSPKQSAIVMPSNLQELTANYGIFQFKFDVFIEILKSFGSFSLIINFNFLEDKLIVSESGNNGSSLLNFSKNYFTKYILPDGDENVYGGFAWDSYLENYIKLEDTDLIIEDINYSHKTSEPLKLEFQIKELDIDHLLYLAPTKSDEDKKIEKYIDLKQKAESLQLKLVRKKILGISLMEEEELKDIIDKIKKYPSKKESEILEKELNELENNISLKLKPLVKEAVKTFLINF